MRGPGNHSHGMEKPGEEASDCTHPEKLPTLREEKEDYSLLDLNLKKQEQHKP